jgi:hypothetical protein
MPKAVGETKIGVRWDVAGLERQMDFYGKASGNSVMTITDGGVIMPNPSYGVDYYVNGNTGDDTKSGRGGWGNAMKTLTVALAASHASIASSPLATGAGWAARNRIHCVGDAFTEDLVLLAQKTDIIGYGSYNQWMKAGVVGKHVPISATGIGVRWFNFHFRTATAGDIFTLDATQRGIEFHNCTFDATADSGNNTAAIIATAVWFLRIYNCQFVGPFSDAAIEIGAGNAQGLDIRGNYIEGANQGIDINGSTTTSPNKGVIRENVIHTSTECINDGNDVMAIINNNCTTLQAKGSAGAGAIVGDEFLSSGNKISASDLANADWPALGTL